jgi:hypothetical protein
VWKLPRTRSQFIAGVLALVVLAAATLEGCGDSADRSVKIVAPAQGSDVTAGDLKVSVDVKKFDIVDKLGQAPKDGEGHIHYYLDAGEIPTRDGQPAVTNDERTYHAQATKEYTWPNVSVGEHTFAVQLVNNDHTPLRPPVIAQVTVRVRAPGGATLPPRSPTASPVGSPGETTAPTEPPASTPGGGGATSPAPTAAAPTPTTTIAITTTTPTP